jgi:Nucleoside diphosphate kinase
MASSERTPRKVEALMEEGHFSRAWRLVETVFEERSLQYIQSIAMLTVKPEAIIARKLEACVEYSLAHGFLPVSARPIYFNKANTKVLWRFQWNIATPDRLSLYDFLHQQGPGMQLICYDSRPSSQLPASLRLTGMKGSANPADRHEGQLRSVLKAPNRVLVMVHGADEPIDIVRELGIVFQPNLIVDTLRFARRGIESKSAIDLSPHIKQMYQCVSANLFNTESAIEWVLKDLSRAIASAGPAQVTNASRARDALDAARMSSTYMNWKDWERDLTLGGLNPQAWPYFLAAAHCIRCNIPGLDCTLGGTGINKWKAGNGRIMER